MTADIKPYPVYKDPGVPWLGQVPEHWNVRRIKSMFHEKDERRCDGTGALLSLTRTRGIIPHSEATDRLAGAENLSKYKVCGVGDLVMNRMQAWSGMFALSSLEGVVSPDYSVFRAVGSCDVKYFELLFRTPPAVAQFARLSKGIGSGFNRLYTEDFGGVLVAVPPTDEQSSIVRYLDHADRKVRHAIRARQQLIKLLTEQKQAIIQRAVTCGLDPNVRLKPSGVPWLGDVPEHWRLIPFKFLSRRIQNGATPSTAEQEYYENGTVPWFGPSSIGTSIGVGTPVRHLAPTAFAQGKARLINGPAIFVIVIGATAGKMALLDGEGATNQQITAFELRKEDIAPQFCIQQLRLSECWLKSTASTATIPILDSGTVKRLPVAFPSAEEQREILEFLDKELVKPNAAIDTARREIDLLREYRTRLIADVVTGKLDVRGVKVPDDETDVLPEDVETIDDVEAIDESNDAAETDSSSEERA